MPKPKNPKQKRGPKQKQGFNQRDHKQKRGPKQHYVDEVSTMAELLEQENDVNELCAEFQMSEGVCKLTYDKKGRKIEHNDGMVVLKLCRLSDILELLDSPDPVLRKYAQDIADAWAEVEKAHTEEMALMRAQLAAAL